VEHLGTTFWADHTSDTLDVSIPCGSM
jgi:hypothetical protein